MTEDYEPHDTDYSDYYGSTDARPCNNGNAKAFSEVFLLTLYSIVFIIGFIGNGLVLWVLIRYRHKSNMTDVCILNLALSDLFFLMSLPFWAHAAMAQWIFGKFMCHIITGLYMMGLYGRIFFMVLMTLDRYFVIVHPHSIFSRNRSVKMASVLASWVWVLSLFTSLPNIIFAQESHEGNYSICISNPSEAWKSFIYLKLNFLSFCLPMLIMGYCYSRVIPILIKTKLQKRHKVIRIILAVVAAYFLFWTPYNIAIFLQFLRTKGYLSSCEWNSGLSLAMQWVETIAFSHCCLNPIIYAFIGQKFRRAVLRVVKEQFPVCFRKCSTFSQQLSERRSSVFSRSTEHSSTHL